MRGTIGFSTRRRSIPAAIIRWFTCSKWSHTFIIYQSAPETLVLEAGRFQVQLVPLTKYRSSRKWRTVYFEPVGYTTDEVAGGLARVRPDIERPYGWLQLLGFIPVIIVRRLLGCEISNPLRGGVVCSELVLDYLRGLDTSPIWRELAPDSTCPEMLFERIANHPRFRIRY